MLRLYVVFHNFVFCIKQDGVWTNTSSQSAGIPTNTGACSASLRGGTVYNRGQEAASAKGQTAKATGPVRHADPAATARPATGVQTNHRQRGNEEERLGSNRT